MTMVLLRVKILGALTVTCFLAVLGAHGTGGIPFNYQPQSTSITGTSSK
jgi:hypothetical protein